MIKNNSTPTQLYQVFELFSTKCHKYLNDKKKIFMRQISSKLFMVISSIKFSTGNLSSFNVVGIKRFVRYSEEGQFL